MDENTLAALKDSDPEVAYKAISRALTRPVGEGLLDIEILGRSHPVEPGTHVLQDGNAIAVPKASLVQAFVVARNRLGAQQQQQQTEEVLAATAVMLLMDPEHLTAANTRKRLILGSLGQVDALVAREKRLVDSLLTSHLHRHTKSPTLWSHRRWLLELALSSSSSSSSSGVPVDVPGDLERVVMVAGERHPRNYYAWCHARWLVTTAACEAAQAGVILAAAKAWCCRHHTDISGWAFLSFLLHDGGRPSPQLCAATLAEVARLAASLRWENESVWVFLRTLASWPVLGEGDRAEFRAAARALRDRRPADVTLRRTLTRAEQWVRDASRPE